jgi:hypothetical protein
MLTWTGLPILNFSLIYPMNPVMPNFFFTIQIEWSFMGPYSMIPYFHSFCQHLYLICYTQSQVGTISAF